MFIVSPVAATYPVIPGFTGNRPSFAFLAVGLDEAFVGSKTITIVTV